MSRSLSSITCPRCGQPSPRDAAYCGSCGGSLREFAGAQARPQMAQDGSIPFVRHMLQLSSLDAGTQALVLVGFSVVLAAALLLTLAGLNLPRVQLFVLDGQPVRMALPFLLAVIFVFSIGWGYVLAAVVGSSKWLRWPALGLFTIALLEPVASTMGAAQAQGIQLDAQLILQIAAPELALLVPVWTIAAFRAITKRPGITPLTVVGMAGSFLLYFAVYYYLELRFADVSTLGQPVIAFMNMSLTFLLPLYLLAGVDLSELLFLTGVGGWSWIGPRLGRRGGWILAVVVAASALGVEGILDRGAFLRFGSLAYAALWIVVNLLFLRWVIPAVSIPKPPSYPLVFLIVAVAWLGAGRPMGIPELPGGPPASLSLTGAGCLLAVAGLRVRLGRPPLAAMLLLGLMGLWLLFFNLPTALRGISISQLGFPSAVVIVSTLGLIALGFAAERYPVLIVWRAAMTVWTLGIAIVNTYRLIIVIQGGTLQEVLPALQVAILLVALGLVLVSIPLPIRAAGVGMALLGLIGSVAFALRGGPLPVVAIANATVLAIAVVWEVLMSGRRVTNRQGRLWPRNSRVIGFLGYALVGLAVAVFATTVEGLPDGFLNPVNFPAIGLVLFGVPTILYALRAAWLPDRRSLELSAEF